MSAGRASNPVAGSTPAETARRIGGGVPPLRLRTARTSRRALADAIDACLDPDPDAAPDGARAARLPRGRARAASTPTAPLPVLDGPPAADPAERRRSAASGRDPGRPASRCWRCSPARSGARAWRSCSRARAPRCSRRRRRPRGLGPGRGPLLAAAGLGAGGRGARRGRRAAPLARARSRRVGVGVAARRVARLGLGPDRRDRRPRPAGWASDPAIAADSVLGPLVAPEAAARRALVFALAAVALGWLLSARHAADRPARGDALGGGGRRGPRARRRRRPRRQPAGVVVAAAVAVAVEFGLLRGAVARAEPDAAQPPAPPIGSPPSDDRL